MAKFRYNKYSRLAKAVIPSVIGLAALAVVGNAHAQYSTGFDNFNSQDSLSGQDNWDTNDGFTGATYTYPGSTAPNAARSIGQSDGIEAVSNYQTGPLDQQGYVGGNNQNGGALPGTSTVFVTHSTGLAATSSFIFNTDYVVTAPGSNAHDQFGFSFLNSGAINAGSSIFSINFQVASNNSTTVDNVSYSLGGPAKATPVLSLTLNSRYHLTVNVNVASTGSTFSAFITAENPNGSVISGVGAQTIANNVAFTGSISQFAAYWQLANLTTSPANGGDQTGTNNTAYTAPGSNILLFDNVSTAVPEPSTYVLTGAGLLGLAAFARVRRNARA